MGHSNNHHGMVSKFLKDDRGSAAVEYGIIVMAMFMAIIPAFLYVSTGIQVKFKSLSDYFNSL